MLARSFQGPSSSDEEESVLSKATLIAGGIAEFVHNLCGQKKKKKKKEGLWNHHVWICRSYRQYSARKVEVVI